MCYLRVVERTPKDTGEGTRSLLVFIHVDTDIGGCQCPGGALGELGQSRWGALAAADAELLADPATKLEAL